MSQPDLSQNGPSKMKKILSGGESPMSRLPRKPGGGAPADNEKPVSVSKQEQPRKPFISLKSKTTKPKTSATSDPAAKIKTGSGRSGVLPIFWTIASVISLLVNVGVVIVLILVVQLLGGTRAALDFAQSQANGLLGGLHENFVKMDAASIKTQIPVSANIPLNITVPVKATTQITLAEAAVIRNAHVIINTGTLNINASATVTLPADTPLTVNLDFPLQVTDTIPVSLLVDVNIPLNQTELHEPFAGLQKVVEPYYCLLQPEIFVNGIDVCANAAPLLPISPPGNTTP